MSRLDFHLLDVWNELVRDWVIEWLNSSFQERNRNKKTTPKKSQISLAVCFWSYSNCVCWHLCFFFQPNFPANGWNLGERSSFFFPDFLFGQDGRFGTTLFDHPQIISSCGRTCGEWTISVHLFFGLFMILLQIAYKQIGQALRHAKYILLNSIHIRCVTSKFSEIQQVYEDTRSCEITSRMFKGGSRGRQWMLKMAQNKLQMEPFGEVFRRFTGRKQKHTHTQQVGIPKTRVSLESKCFFQTFSRFHRPFKGVFFQKIIVFWAKKRKKIQRRRLEVVGPKLFWDFDKKHFQHFWWPLCEKMACGPQLFHSWRVFAEIHHFLHSELSFPNNAATEYSPVGKYRKARKKPHVRIATSLFFWICPRRSNKNTVVNHPILICSIDIVPTFVEFPKPWENPKTAWTPKRKVIKRGLCRDHLHYQVLEKRSSNANLG